MAEFVLDTNPEAVVVFETVVVFVDVEDAVSVFDIADDTENPGLEDDDLDPVPDLVVVIEAVIVFVEVLVGVSNHVGADDRVDVVVFVDVLDDVVESVGTA